MEYRVQDIYHEWQATFSKEEFLEFIQGIVSNNMDSFEELQEETPNSELVKLLEKALENTETLSEEEIKAVCSWGGYELK